MKKLRRVHRCHIQRHASSQAVAEDADGQVANLVWFVPAEADTQREGASADQAHSSIAAERTRIE